MGGGGSWKDHGLGDCVRRGVQLNAPTGNEASPAPAPVVEEGVLFLSALGALAEEGLVVRRGMAPARVPLADDVVGRGALDGHPPRLADGRVELGGREALAVLGAGGARDVLLDQGAAQVVHP